MEQNHAILHSLLTSHLHNSPKIPNKIILQFLHLQQNSILQFKLPVDMTSVFLNIMLH